MDYDAAIVLGSRILPDGSLLVNAKNRVEAAVKAYNSGIVRVLLFTGGQKESLLTEAQAMSNYALSLGVSPADVFLENFALDTLANALLTKPIVEENGWQKILLITSDFHMRRAHQLFSEVMPLGVKVGKLEVKTGYTQEELEQIIAVEEAKLTGFRTAE